MPFTDTHVHLHFPDYDADRDAVISRARDAGLDYFINVGTDVPSSRQSLALAEKYPFVYASAGIHPHDAKDADATSIKEISEILAHPRMVAIGEVGLDYYRDHSPQDKQKEVLREFVRIHTEIKKPLIVHCRDAYDDLLALFKEGNVRLSGVMHCFSSDRPVMERFLELGFYISFAGPLTYKKNDALREACKACPIDRLLLETDAPFLPPQSLRGKRNESSYMLETAKTAAELHGLPLAELGNRTTENAKRLFRL